MSLSQRIRANIEAAPWVVDEVKSLEATLAASEMARQREANARWDEENRLNAKLAAAESLIEAFNRDSVIALAIRERDDAFANLSAAEARIGRLRELALRTHYSCEDSFYSCPKSTDGCYNDGAGTECNCGADEHNAEVERVCNDTPPQAEGASDGQ